MTRQSPSQTVGPFFHNCLIQGHEHILTSDQTLGERIVIQGHVLDGDGVPIPDALVEIWQADAGGFFNHPQDPNRDRADGHFRGFGRSETADSGRFTFQTIKPGVVAGHPAPFINVRVFARGMLIHAVTRLYFEDEKGNEQDDLLGRLPAARRHTLIATADRSTLPVTYRFDIHLQGDRETVFFDF